MLGSLRLVAEHPEFIIVDKPVGIAVHSSPSEPDNGLNITAQLRTQLNDPELYPCHRLDAVTSGLLIVAKGKKANQALSQQFQEKAVQKFYIALSDKKPVKKQGLVKGDMTPARRGDWKIARTYKNPAITQFFSYGLGDGLRLFVLKPLTGKTHQLRVMMKSLGSPILGDSRYGGSDASRCYLHAYSLAFRLSGQDYQFVSEPTSGKRFLAEGLKSALTKHSPLASLPWPKL